MIYEHIDEENNDNIKDNSPNIIESSFNLILFSIDQDL